MLLRGRGTKFAEAGYGSEAVNFQMTVLKVLVSYRPTRAKSSHYLIARPGLGTTPAATAPSRRSRPQKLQILNVRSQFRIVGEILWAALQYCRKLQRSR